MLNRDLTRRTAGEELWCRRRKAGLGQARAAKRLGVGRTTLQAAEADATTLKRALAARFAPGLPELLALARQRSGWGLRGAARRAGISHVTLLLWEREADRRLIAFWTKNRFTFA